MVRESTTSQSVKGIFICMSNDLLIEKKGCVYFFRHIGLTPVKIGFSTSESPIDRFDQFKTYAPYGSELIGFIRTSEPNKLESILHERFSQYRLSGEWFEITQEQCNSVISFYSNIEDIKEMNEFQISWAKKLKTNLIDEMPVSSKLFSIIDIWFESYDIGSEMSNFKFEKEINSISESKYNIKVIKKELKKYCDLKKMEILERNSNGSRYFSILRKS